MHSMHPRFFMVPSAVWVPFNYQVSGMLWALHAFSARWAADGLLYKGALSYESVGKMFQSCTFLPFHTIVIAILFIQTTKEYFSHRKRIRHLNYLENEGTNFAFRYNTLDRWGYLDCSELNLQLFSQTIQFTLFLVNHPTGSKRLMSSARIASRSGRKVSACFELVNKMKRLEQKSTLNVGPSSFFARFEIGPICFKKLPSCQLTKNNCMASTL